LSGPSSASIIINENLIVGGENYISLYNINSFSLVKIFTMPGTVLKLLAIDKDFIISGQ
jgi:hypothetical protein